MNSFAYNPRSEVLYSLFGTNETDYAYDDIGNHSLYPANNLNQYVDNAIEYDADGNMTRKGGWTFGWDAENRLASADNGTTSITNAYDYKHRRVRKTVGSESHAFAYDDWNLISETINDTERTHYFWGLDLSDSLQGAGGVGGLLAVSQDGAMYYPVCDNNGNVTAYLDDLGNIVASYEYNAFGEILSQSGSRADEFVFRFSTKYHDNETGLYYYGYRFYDPTLRTWLNRDPIEEEGGVNLYGFCENNGFNKYDYLGTRGDWLQQILDQLKNAAGYICPSPASEAASALECGPEAIDIIVLKKLEQRLILAMELNDPTMIEATQNQINEQVLRMQRKQNQCKEKKCCKKR